MTLNGEKAVMLHYFVINLSHGRAVLFAIAELLVSNLRTAVERILSISSALLFTVIIFFLNQTLVVSSHNASHCFVVRSRDCWRFTYGCRCRPDTAVIIDSVAFCNSWHCGAFQRFKLSHHSHGRGRCRYTCTH